MPRMKRYVHDLSHGCFTVGRIGRIQCLAAVPVVAGDSFAVRMDVLLRLSQLRRPLSVDAFVDYCAFYVPHRHAFGQKWIDFVEEGIDETETFGGVSVAANENPHFLTIPHRTTSHTLFKPLSYAYNSIWNRYYRLPLTDEINLDAPNVLNCTANPVLASAAGASPPKASRSRVVAPGTSYTYTVDDLSNQLDYGYVSALLKRPWTVSNRAPSPADRRVALQSSQLDILEFAKIEARYKTEVEREWLFTRYNDILKGQFGSGVNIDADERPRLIARKTLTTGGYDVDGTDDATLGQATGKAWAQHNFGHGLTFFPEHGYYMVLAVMRFPLIVPGETHPVHHQPNPTYKFIVGDPDLWRLEPPQPFDPGAWFGKQVGAVDPGPITAAAADVEPYGQHYRYHPSFVHRRYDEVQGFLFTGTEAALNVQFNRSPYNAQSMLSNRGYYEDRPPASNSGLDSYDSVFQTLALEHWHAACRFNIHSRRHIPPASASVFAGTR